MIVWTLGAALAAPCDGHALFVEGTSMTLTSYNPKGKVTGTVVSENRDVRSDGSAQIHAVASDKKGKETMTVDYDVRCGAGGALSIDMEAFLPADVMGPYGNQYDVRYESTELLFPAPLSGGQSLPDATVTAHLTLKGGDPSPLGNMTVRVHIQDRKVVGQESVTVPAGTFDAYKITSTSELTTRSVVSFTLNLSVTEWYVPGLGVVRSESFKPNGKQVGYNELTALQKGG